MDNFKIYNFNEKMAAQKVEITKSKDKKWLIISIFIITFLFILMFVNEYIFKDSYLFLLIYVFSAIPIVLTFALIAMKCYFELIGLSAWQANQKHTCYITNERNEIYLISEKLNAPKDGYSNFAAVTNSVALDLISILSLPESLKKITATGEKMVEKIVNVYKVKKDKDDYIVICDVYNAEFDSWKLKQEMFITNYENKDELIKSFKAKLQETKIPLKKQRESLNKKMTRIFCERTTVNQQKHDMYLCYTVFYVGALTALGYAEGKITDIVLIILPILALYMARIYAQNFDDMYQNNRYILFNNLNLIIYLILFIGFDLLKYFFISN